MVVNPRIADSSVEVDWIGDGFGGAYDDVTDDVRNQPGISITRGKDAARPRSAPMIPSADFTLGNVNKRYSAENAGGPLYQFILPDRRVRIAMLPGVDLAYDDPLYDYDDPEAFYDAQPTVYLFKGLSEEPVYQPDREQQSVAIRVLGSMAALRGVTISTQLYTAIRTDTAIGHILDAVSWPAADRVISVGDTTMDWWWADNQDAWSALMDLLETEGTGASLYEDGQGRIVFENRNYRQTASRSTASQVTFEVGTDLGFTNFGYAHGMRDVYNDVYMTIKRRAALSSAKVWEYGSSLTLAPSELRTVIAKSGGDPWQSVQNVTVTTDYVVSAGSLVSVTTTVLTATSVAITFVAGGGGATLLGPASATTGIQLRAAEVTVTSEELVRQTVAIGTFVTRAQSLDLTQEGARAEISKASAQALADAAAEYYREARPTVSIEIVNVTADQLEQILTREVSDRITINEGPNGFMGDIWIEQITHVVTIGGRLHRCGIVGSKALDFTASPATWDAGLWNSGNWGT